MMDLFGIPNCNTVKKARDWLTDHGLEYTFHNFKKEAPTEALLSTWLEQESWETLVNRAGMTWRKLTDEEKAAVNDNASAIQLMIAKSSVIKRPILIKDGKILNVGFKEAAYEALFDA
jgi:Spx/MgsR family transcriptional regulator